MVSGNVKDETMLKMYDSTTATDIPPDADMVMGYVDGAWPNWFEVRQLFSHLSPHHTPTVATSPLHDADILDVEPGNFQINGSDGFSLSEVSKWVNRQRKIKPHQAPVVYVSLAFVDVVKESLRKDGVDFPQWFIADWTGIPHLVLGSVATQYADPSTSGGHYDVTWVSPNFPTLLVPSMYLHHPSSTVHEVKKTLHSIAGKSPTTTTSVEPKKEAGTMTVSTASLETLIRKLGSYAVVVNDFTNTAHISPTVKSVLTAAAGLILAIDHWATKK
jgi:hypothetical protein